MVGVAGGVSPRTRANGQQPVVDPNLLSASTSLQQSGGGGYARLVDALQSLDQIQNILVLASQITTFAADIATLQGQVATIQGQITSLQGQIGVINGQISGLQTAVVNLNSEIGALQAQLDGVSFGAVGGPASIVAGSLTTTISGTQYLLQLYSS